MRFMKQKIFAVAVVFNATVLSATMFSATAMAQNLATIDGDKLSVDAYKQAAESLGPRAQMMLADPNMRKQFLDHMIDNRLLSKAAAKKGVDKSPDFQNRMDEARMQILATLFTEIYIDENTTDKKMEEFFKKNTEQFSTKEIKASHILVKEEDEAKNVLAEAQKKGADFAELAKKHSTGPSGPKGGDLGYFKRGSMVPEFEAAAFATKPGEIHAKPVKTQFGYHIIKVTDVKGGEAVKFADVKDKVKERMERDLRDTLVEDLRKSAKIEVNDKALESMKF